MALVDPALRKRITKLQKSIGRSKGAATKRRAELAKLMARRKNQIELNTLYNPSAQMTPQMLKSSVDQLTASEVNPLKAQRAAAQAGGDQANANIEAVFRQLGVSQQAALQASGQIGQRAVSATQQAGQAQTAAQSAAAAQAQAEIDKDAALRGQANVGDARAALAQAVATRTADSAALQSAREAFTGNIAASGQNFLAQMGQAQQMRGTELAAGARGELANRIAEINAQIANVEGPGRTEKILKLRSDAQQALAESAAFGLDKYKATTNAAYQRASVKQRDKASQRTARQRALDRREKRRQARAERDLKRELKDTADSGKTPAERKKRRGALNQAIAVTRQQNRKHPLYAHKNRRTNAIDQIVEAYGEDGVTREDAQRIVWSVAFPGVPFYKDKPKKATKRIRP